MEGEERGRDRGEEGKGRGKDGKDGKGGKGGKGRGEKGRGKQHGRVWRQPRLDDGKKDAPKLSPSFWVQNQRTLADNIILSDLHRRIEMFLHTHTHSHQSSPRHPVDHTDHTHIHIHIHIHKHPQTKVSHKTTTAASSTTHTLYTHSLHTLHPQPHPTHTPPKTQSPV